MRCKCTAARTISILDRWGTHPAFIGLAVLAVFGFLFAQARWSLFTGDPVVDSYSYYFASEALQEGRNPYDPGALRSLAENSPGSVHPFPYLYPPVLALLWRPFTLVEPTEAHHIWIASQTLLALCNLGLLWSMIRPPVHTGAWFLALVLMHGVCGPLVSTLRIGQVNVLVGTLVFAALVLERRKHAHLAGASLALAILIKLTPAIVLVDLVVRRRWRTLLACLLSGGLIVLFIVLCAGWTPWVEFLAMRPHAWLVNPHCSLEGLVRAAGDRIHLAEPPRQVVIALALVGLGVYLLRRLRGLWELGGAGPKLPGAL